MLETWLPQIRSAYTQGGTIPYDQATDGLGGAGNMETNGDRMGPFDQLELSALPTDQDSPLPDESPTPAAEPGSGG